MINEITTVCCVTQKGNKCNCQENSGESLKPNPTSRILQIHWSKNIYYWKDIYQYWNWSKFEGHITSSQNMMSTICISFKFLPFCFHTLSCKSTPILSYYACFFFSSSRQHKMTHHKPLVNYFLQILLVPRVAKTCTKGCFSLPSISGYEPILYHMNAEKTTECKKQKQTIYKIVSKSKNSDKSKFIAM